MQVLGTLVKCYYEKIDHNSALEVKRYSLETIKKLFDARAKIETQWVAGALFGIDQLLFSPLEFGQDELEDIFKTCRHIIQPFDELQRYDLPKVGFLLLSHHAKQFQGHIFDNYQNMVGAIDHGVGHRNAEVYKIAEKASDSFIRLVDGTHVGCSSYSMPSRSPDRDYIGLHSKPLRRKIKIG